MAVMALALAMLLFAMVGFGVAFCAPPIGKANRARQIQTMRLLQANNANMQNKEQGSESNESLRGAIERLASILNSDEGPPILSSSATGTQTKCSHKRQSSAVVHIIGTGLTPTLSNLPLSSLLVLSRADAVLYDSLGLSLDEIRRVIPDHCELTCVGKRGDRKSWKQEDIDELLLKVAAVDGGGDHECDETPRQTVKTVVRLKGGDPFLFGRTRTEIESLRANDVSYTYTPGVSSCIAGPHLGGIPLTDALLDCQSFGVWSGTDAFGRSWGLAENDGTNRGGRDWSGLDVDVLVFLMIGRLDKLEALCRSIIAQNDNYNHESTTAKKWSKETPCAVIQNAGGRRVKPSEESSSSSSHPIQRVWRSTLDNIVSVIKEEDETRTSVSPAVFVVGATAALDLLSQDLKSEGST